MKLPAPAGNAPAEPAMPPMAPEAAPTDGLDFGGEIPTDTEQPQEAPSSESPLDKEPFDAGIDVDEESDPKNYIEKLSGKIGQSLRAYTQKQGQPDFELEKFAINSLISATHTAEMDENDKNDIIKKINTAGNDDSENPDMGDDNNAENSGDDNNNGGGIDFGGDSNDGMEENKLFEEEESIFLKNPKKNNMFQVGSNDILDETKPCWSGYEQIGMKTKNGKEVPNCVPLKENNLTVSEKRTIFRKDEIKSKLQETFNNKDMSEPFVEPITKPKTEPTTPSRRNKPFTIEPDTIPIVPPKALNEGKEQYEVYHNSFSSAVQTAHEYAKSKGFSIDDNEWFNTISTGPRKPQEGITNRYTITLYKDGKEQRKALQIQVYGMSNKYELNTYIS